MRPHSGTFPPHAREWHKVVRGMCRWGADLGDGIATPVVAGEGAIDPFERSCGRVWGRSPPMLTKGAQWREECAARAAAEGIMLPCWW